MCTISMLAPHDVDLVPEHQDLSFKPDPGPEPRSKDAARQNEQIDHLPKALTDSDQFTKPDWVFDRDRERIAD